MTVTDAEVRRAAGAPPTGCSLCRTRPRHSTKALRSSPPTLLALLSSRPLGRLLPWVALIVADMHKLRSLSSLCAPLPCPEEAPGAWVAFALESPHRWARAVACLFFVDSACDVRPAAADGMLHPFACAECDARFLNARALPRTLGANMASELRRGSTRTAAPSARSASLLSAPACACFATCAIHDARGAGMLSLPTPLAFPSWTRKSLLPWTSPTGLTAARRRGKAARSPSQLGLPAMPKARSSARCALELLLPMIM